MACDVHKQARPEGLEPPTLGLEGGRPPSGQCCLVFLSGGASASSAISSAQWVSVLSCPAASVCKMFARNGPEASNEIPASTQAGTHAQADRVEWLAGSGWSVDVRSVVDAQHDDLPGVFLDSVKYPEGSPPRRPDPLKLSLQWMADAPRVLKERTGDQTDHGGRYSLRQVLRDRPGRRAGYNQLV